MMQNKLLLAFVFLSCISLNSQNLLDDKNKKLQLGLTIAQGSENTFTQSQPAKFIATFPENSEVDDTYAINGYISVDVFLGYKENSPFKLSAVFEKHQNTLIDKEQDVIQVGASMEFFIKQGDKKYPSWVHKPILSFKQSEDKINDTEGLQYLVYYSIRRPKKFKGGQFWNTFRPNVITPADKRNNTPLDKAQEDSLSVAKHRELQQKANKIDWTNLGIADFIQLKHSHAIGFEHLGYEDLSMLNLSFNLQVYPFSGLLYSVFKRYGVVEVKYAVVHREELSSSNTELFVGTYLNRGVAINIRLDDDDKKVISLGYDHFQGGNPLKGLANNEYGQLSIGAIVKL